MIKYSPETLENLNKMLHPGKGILIFDDKCVLCNASVSFLLKRDKEKKLFYTTFNSDFLRQAGFEFAAREEPQSLIFADQDGIYTESAAVIKIAGAIGSSALLRNIAKLIPVAFRNQIYRFIAQHRYRWFGKTNQCIVPSPDDANRFLK